MKNAGWFKFLSSLKLAVVLLAGLALVLAAGTWVESLTSAATARRVVYGTLWFSLILFLLAVNVLFSALSRWPWKRRQAGFVTTHAGILLILLGSLLTQLNGLDGQLALAEGETLSVIREDSPFFYVSRADGPLEKIPVRFLFRNPSMLRPQIHPLAGGGTLAFTGILKNGEKTLSAAAPSPGAPSWPAVRLRLNNKFSGWAIWMFLGHPEYSHFNLGPSLVSFVAERDFLRAGEALPRNGLLLARADDGSLKFQSKFKGRLQPLRKIGEKGGPYPAGWMDLELSVLESREAAVPATEYLEAPVLRGEEAVPAVRYRYSRVPERAEGWIEWQSRTVVSFGGKPVTLSFGPQQTHLPFALRLDKFDIGFNPGTTRPASFASRMYLVDREKGVEKAVTIRMNEPLNYRGFTFFQASYSTSGEGTVLSVFSVAKDPGIPLKYIGSLVLVLGILLMYLLKKRNEELGIRNEELQSKAPNKTF